LTASPPTACLALGRQTAQVLFGARQRRLREKRIPAFSGRRGEAMWDFRPGLL